MDKDLTKLKKLKSHLDDVYYNTGDSVVTDSEYDAIKEEIMRCDPNYVPEVGAKIRDGENRVKLPYWLGSADKITEEKVLQRWLNKNKSKEYVITSKLDGVSCLLCFKNGEMKLYTRGDGVIGADISFLQKYISFPCIKEEISIRGELIMDKEIFQTKHSTTYKNPRNMVSGLISGKTARAGLTDIHFVAYEIITDDETQSEQKEQLKKLKSMGFETVKHKFVRAIDIESLSNTYISFRGEERYELDGIIIQKNTEYQRNNSGNPGYMFAFKMLLQDSVRETTVKEVEWNVSKWGQLKPVVIVDPLELGGVTISRATAHNAKFIVDNNIGEGAIIKITRSKEVIPYIVEVVKGATPSMPSDIHFVWDETKVNICVQDSSDEMCIKLVASFFKELNIKHVAEATVKKMFQSGFDNLIKIVSASKDDLRTIPEFGEKSVERVYTSIKNGLKDITLAQLLGASNVLGYGIGSRKIEALLSDLPNLFALYGSLSDNELVQKIIQIKGFSTTTAEKIVGNLDCGLQFIEQISPYITLKEEEVKTSGNLSGQVVVMSGFRDKELEEKIKQNGGSIGSSITSKTTILIVKDKTQTTTKIQKAKEKGVKIYSIEEFYL
jgi:DNA ligase (NAD+)